jgi:hypothetical protein
MKILTKERMERSAAALSESRRRIREAYRGDPTFTTLSGEEVVYRTVPPNLRVERVRVGRSSRERGA